MSETTVRRLPKRRAVKKTAKRSTKNSKTKQSDDDPVRPAVGTLTRTKSLLLAALRVWELKQGIRD